jgi:hypothetical protein
MIANAVEIWKSLPAGVSRDMFEAKVSRATKSLHARYEAQDRARKVLVQFIMRCDHNSQQYFTIEAMSRLLMQDAPLSALHALAKARRFRTQNQLANI